MNKIRPIAVYLPQFHPISENNKWWGKGFTEWTNVVKAKPRFKGHYQPHLPADLGFYDLRLPEIRQAQADLARQYGIYGFCYYHYWFNGKRLLERPFEEVFQSGKPDFPFMLCWANENWTRAWDGGEKEILIEQKYSLKDDIQHINSLIPYFKDNRYIKVNGKPVFAIYKDSLFPNIKETIQVFREVAKKHKLELYLCRFDRNAGTLPVSHELLGFDASIEFQPLSFSCKEFIENKNKGILKYLNLENYARFFFNKIIKKDFHKDLVIDFKKFVSFDMNYPQLNHKIFPCVSPGWDNSSRRPKGKAVIFKNSSPEIFRQWVSSKLDKYKPYSRDENFLFINAWNEWAEGNHLEPCEKWGHAYLNAFSDALNEISQNI